MGKNYFATFKRIQTIQNWLDAENLFDELIDAANLFTEKDIKEQQDQGRRIAEMQNAKDQGGKKI